MEKPIFFAVKLMNGVVQMISTESDKQNAN